MSDVETICYDSWEQFKSELFMQVFGARAYVPRACLFRGQASGDWPLKSSFDRWYETWGKGRERAKLADELIRCFLEECEELGLDISLQSTDLQAIALAQHYGIPTRLLDWSESPYVAAFFAYQSHLQAPSAATDYVAIWVLNRRAPVWDGSGMAILRPPRVKNVRLRNQSGAFTLSTDARGDITEWVRQQVWPGTVLWRVLLPVEAVAAALSDLTAMGITPTRLFPELEGAAAAAMQRLSLAR